jgi:hypothetical protein
VQLGRLTTMLHTITETLAFIGFVAFIAALVLL